MSDTNPEDKKLYRGDYRIRKNLQDFANKNRFVQIFIKPIGKRVYNLINPFFPYPRDFLLKQIPKNGCYAEVGVYAGVFSERIVRLCKPSKLFLIDPWKYFEEEGYFPDGKSHSKYKQEEQDNRLSEVKDKLKKEIDKGTVIIVRKTSEDALMDLKDEKLDFVYIDGNHDYEFVKFDIENYYKLLKSGGFLCGDDYRLPQIQKAVKEFMDSEGLKEIQVKNDQFILTKPTE